MRTGLKALENIKREAGTPYFSTLYDIDMWREDFATIEKELIEGQKNKQALEVVFKYITIGNPFGNVHYIYLNDESEMIMPKDFEVLKEVLP